MSIPVAALWQETIGFIRRESALLVPLSLATLGLGDAGTNLIAGIIRSNAAAGEWASGAAIGLVFALLLSVLGQLAIMSLALSRGGLSVGEALRVATRRLPRIVLVSMLIFWGVLLLLLPLLLMLASSGVDLSTPNPKIPPLASFYGFLISGLIIWAGIRLLPLNAMIVDRESPILTVLRDTFRATRGHAAILLALGAVYVLAWAVATTLIGTIVGAIFAPLSTALGVPFAGNVMVALAGGMVAAAMGMISAVFIARLYQHLGARS